MICAIVAETDVKFKSNLTGLLRIGILEPILRDFERFQKEPVKSTDISSGLAEMDKLTKSNPFGPMAHIIIQCALESVHLQFTPELSNFLIQFSKKYG